MRLVIQCSLCGTIHTVGTAVCGTCRASGFRDLRLLFECLGCFQLGLGPTCEVCNRKAPPLAYGKSTPDAIPPVGDTPEGEALDAELEMELSEFELALDDLPVAELDDDELRLEDDSDTDGKGG
jgi:hypothetical protein